MGHGVEGGKAVSSEAGWVHMEGRLRAQLSLWVEKQGSTRRADRIEQQSPPIPSGVRLLKGMHEEAIRRAFSEFGRLRPGERV